MPDPSLVRFRAVVHGALAHLESRRQEINDLNVFPVADGDTGDNMALTLQAVLEEVETLAAIDDRTLDEIGRSEVYDRIARAALLGARGNSGVILSQLVRGAAEELISKPGELVDPIMISSAMHKASERAYASVRNPVEGTMLTVMRAMAGAAATALKDVENPRLGRRVERRTAERAHRRGPREGDRGGGGGRQARPRAAARAARGGRRRRRRLRGHDHLRRRRRGAARRRGAGAGPLRAGTHARAA